MLVLCLFSQVGCRSTYVPPEAPLPANTVLLSQMMRELSKQPGFTEALLHEIEGAKSEKHGPALLTPKLADELRKRIVGEDWSGLDRFPGWTMRAINPAVGVAGKVVGGESHDAAVMSSRLDVQPYSLEKTEKVSLDEPSRFSAFTTEGIVTELGAGVVRGDGPNALASEHAESQRLANLLNRLAANGMNGVATDTATAMVTQDGSWERMFFEQDASNPEELIGLLQASGHTVTVTDSRYFANFGHLHYKGRDVMMPFWIDTQIAVPGTGGLFHRPRPLLVPVAHAELEWHVRGPHLNADVSWYFGIDGKAEWRTMDTLDQAWVMKRDAHTYTGKDAVEVTRLAGRFTVAYLRLFAKHVELPFGGYYALGVCQDAVSAVEHKMTGHVTLFPNTADTALFNDPRDAEVNTLIAAIPKDRAGAEPEPERVFGSLPLAPATDAEHAFDAVTVPGLAADLNAVYAAWKQGDVERTHGARFYVSVGAVAAAVVCGVMMAMLRRRRR